MANRRAARPAGRCVTAVKDGLSMIGVPIYRKSLTDGSNDEPTTAVAAGIVPVIIGTDIVGPVPNPALFCGLFGHKPSYGRVPYYP